MVNGTYKPAQTKTSGSVAVPNRQQTTGALSILIADDTPAYQKIVRQVLQDRGHSVTHVNDGKQAAQLCENNQFDVIVVDVQMPLMNGFELARWIRSRENESHRRTPIIAISAHSESAGRTESTESGVDAYLTKPIDLKHFIEVVESLAANPSGQHMKSKRSKEFAGTRNTEGKHGVSEGGPIVDYDGAMVRLGGDHELFREFIAVYDEDVPSLLGSLRTAVHGHDGRGVERNAHSVRGLISNFGARRAVEAAAQIEEIGKHSRWEEVTVALEKLELEIKLLSEALDEYRR